MKYFLESELSLYGMVVIAALVSCLFASALQDSMTLKVSNGIERRSEAGARSSILVDSKPNLSNASLVAHD